LADARLGYLAPRLRGEAPGEGLVRNLIAKR